MARTRLALHTYRRTDGRTYTEGGTIYVSRRGRHIIITMSQMLQGGSDLVVCMLYEFGTFIEMRS